MLSVIFAIGSILLSLLASGVIFALVVCLTMTVGAYLKKRLHDHKKKTALVTITTILKDFKNQKEQEEANKLKNALGKDALVTWLESDQGEVDTDSIEIIDGRSVDAKTKAIMDEYDGYITIDPMAV